MDFIVDKHTGATVTARIGEPARRAVANRWDGVQGSFDDRKTPPFLDGGKDVDADAGKQLILTRFRHLTMEDNPTTPNMNTADESSRKNTMGFGKNKSRPLGERLQILLQHLVDELP